MDANGDERAFDPYDVLGVPQTATDAEVTSAYRRLARELHPDANPGADPIGFRRLVAAYETLGDRARRDEYDASHRRRETTGAATSGGVDVPVRRVSADGGTSDVRRGATSAHAAVRCPACGGTGGVARQCPACGGAGYGLASRTRWLAVPLACPLCQGRRRLPVATCRTCGGLGAVRPGMRRTR
ncbi:MAG TPA: DnaJ domain-containing protein [Acidimicrobiia bacterium]|nr:DnaJ domain-containing protein [Acidimicrobiia bacterium]